MQKCSNIYRISFTELVSGQCRKFCPYANARIGQMIFSSTKMIFAGRDKIVNIYKDFINRTCQWVSVVHATHIMGHILQCASAHDCIGYHWISVNENLCLIDGVTSASEKDVGWNPLRWNRQSPVHYPSYNPPPFHLLSTHLTNPSLKMGPFLEIEELGWKYWQFAGNITFLFCP